VASKGITAGCERVKSKTTIASSKGSHTMKSLLRAATVLTVGLGFILAQAGDVSAQSRHKGGGGGGGGGFSKPKGPPHHGGKHHGGKHHGGKNHGGKIAGGIAAGILGAVILNEIAKSNQPKYDNRSYYSGGGGGELSCRQLARRCEDGRDWACRKFDRQC
jgi:hypothetical protein